MKRPFTKKTSCSEQGVYMVLMSGLLIGFMILFGLAVDSANLYRAQLRLQRAVDAGAIGGTYLIGTSPSNAEAVARNIAQDNISHMGLGNFPVSASLNANQLIVASTVNVPLWFMQMVPGIGDTRSVSATAQAESVQTAVALVLDRTASMNCPAFDTQCYDCQQFPNQQRCLPSKLDKLKEATITFVNLFEDGTDIMAMVSFSSTAIPDMPMGTLNKSEMFAAINALQGAGNTNIQVGIAEAQVQLDSDNVIPGYRKVMVIVTDGSPVTGETSLQGLVSCPPNFPGFGPPSTFVDRVHQQLRTIAQADIARADTGATIYTIGYGPQAPENLSPPFGVYQNPLEQHTLKSYLLKRIANSSEAANDPVFHCVPSYSAYNSTSGRSKGTYFAAPTTAELQSSLISVGMSIKARMVQ